MLKIMRPAVEIRPSHLWPIERSAMADGKRIAAATRELVRAKAVRSGMSKTPACGFRPTAGRGAPK